MATAISQFRNRILSEVPGCPIPRVDQAIVDAMRQFCEDTHCFEKTIEAVHTLDAEWPFAMPFSFEQSYSGGFYLITIDFTDYTSLTGYNPIMPVFFQINAADCGLVRYDIDHLVSSMESITPSGKKFYRFNGLTEMEIFPFQDGEDVSTTIITSLAMKPANSSTSVDDVFFNEYLDAIAYGATARLQAMTKRPWTDYNGAAFHTANYRAEVGKHKTVSKMGGFYGSAFAQGGYF